MKKKLHQFIHTLPHRRGYENPILIAICIIAVILVILQSGQLVESLSQQV